MIDSAIFIGTLIIACTQAVKFVWPQVSGAVTILVAAVLGALVGLVDTHIGVVDITVAQGILIALSSVGVVTVASKTGTKA